MFKLKIAPCILLAMKNSIQQAVDARQTLMWGKYMQGIGWQVEKIGSTQIFIRKIPLLGSFIKIEHPIGPFDFKKIDQLAKNKKAMMVIFEPHSLNYDQSQFLNSGYQPGRELYSHSATIKIDLTQNETALLKSFSENARRNIKKAQQNKLEIKAIFMKDKKNWQYFDQFYELLKTLSRMRKFYIENKKDYQTKMSAFKNNSVLLFAYENNQPITVVWYAYFQGVLAYFQTGITKRGYETFANYLLVWEGLKLGKKLGCKIFDFESIFDERFPKQHRSKLRYTDFKKRFHGEIILYPQPWVKTYNLWGKIFYLCSLI